MGDAAVSALLQVLFDRLTKLIHDEFQRVHNFDDLLRRLHASVEHFRAIIRDADPWRTREQSVNQWLRELKTAVFEAEDVVDEVSYELLRQEVEVGRGPVGDGEEESHQGRQRRHHKVRDAITFRFSKIMYGGDPGFRRVMAERIDNVCKKLDRIVNRSNAIHVVTSNDGANQHQLHSRSMRETSSLIHEPSLFGRETEKEEIIRMLLDSGDGTRPPSTPSDDINLSVLPIVGIGGIGKTTLAQHVYNDNRVKSYFDVRMWVCVTDDFDVKRITKQMCERVGSPEEKSHDFGNLNTLQESLSEKLDGKRFLVVLDDVWNDNREEWLKLQAPLVHGAKGSMLLVTTRMDSVVDTMDTLAPIYLRGLSFEHCWSLIKTCASFRGDLRGCQILEPVNGKMVEIISRLKGIPLAVKTLGRILSSKVEEAGWREILESEVWEWPQEEGDILPVLSLSYEHLPLHLKKCFAYCSLFPKDHQFEKSKLVKLWMAHGYIEVQGKRMEDVGSGYFDELVHRSFFIKDGDHYVVQDLFIEFALFVSKHEYARIENENWKKILDKDCHHLSFSVSKLKPHEMNLYKLNTLRSLLYISQNGAKCLELPPDLFVNLKHLRVLDLSRSNIECLPKSIDALIHLRYLDLSHSNIRELLDSISKLYNLQTLELKGCAHLREISSAVLSLVNLRHLNASNGLISKLSGIGKLSSLQELELFDVSKEKGFNLAELKNMNELRGRLHILNLQNVESKEDPYQAKLEGKKHLDELMLEWPDKVTSHRDLKLEGLVLEGLRPPPELTILYIKGNAGLEFPNWMDNHNIYSLRSINLCYCRNWNHLPPLGNLPALTFLKMEYLLAVEKFESEFYEAFPSLKVLELRHMHQLKEWSTLNTRRSFLRLQEILIEDCPRLEKIIQLPPSLKSLKIEKCPRLLNNTVLLQRLASLPSLSCSLEYSYRDLQSCVTETMKHLIGLEGLEICHCDESVTSRRWSLRPPWMPFSYSQGRAADEIQLSNISYNIHDGSDIRIFLLYAHNFPGYPDVRRWDVCLRTRNYGDDDHDYHSLSRCLRDNLSSLRRLSVKACPNIPSLLGQSVLLHLTALERLEIDECNMLRTLEWFPKEQDLISLKTLRIGGCPDLTTIPRLKLIKLEELHVKNCEELASLDLCELASLKHMEIVGCPKLSSGLFLHEFKALKELKIRRCPQLISFPNAAELGLCGLTSLQCFEINSFDKIQQLPANLKSLSSLKRLSIMHCPRIRSLPETGLPASLEELTIEECPLLQKRCQMGGPDWSRISHIPKRKISCQICYPYGCCCSNR